MAIVMYTDRNTIIPQYLGAINCGQSILTEQQQFEVYFQIITHLINNDQSLKNAIPKVFAHKPCLPYFQQTAPNDRYFTDNHIVNIARAYHIPVSEASRQIGEQRFSVHMDNLFGYKYPEDGYKSKYAPRSLFLELKFDYRSPMLPEFFKFNDLEFKLYFTLQYSETDGDFLAGEVFYYDKSGKYFPINISYKRRIEENPDSVKEIILGYNFNHSILLNKNLMVDHTKKPIVLFHDKIIAAILCNTHDSFPFIPSTYNFTYTNCKIDLSDLKYRDVILVPLHQIESYMSILKLAEMLEDKYKATVRICNYSIYPSATFNLDNSIHKEEYAIQEIVEHSISHEHVKWDEFLSDSKHLLLPRQYDRWLEKIYLKHDAKPAKPTLMSISDLATGLIHSDKQNEIHDILAPHTVSFCYGPSTAGKSIWALTMALSFACGFDIFDFSSTTHKKVLYIDYETPEYTFNSNIEQLISAYQLDRSLIHNNFKLQLRDKDPNIGPIWAHKSETQYIQGLCETIKDEHISLIIIDTLVKASPDAVSSSSLSMLFMEYLSVTSKELDIVFLILHHSNNAGNMVGSSQFFNSATNAFKLDKLPSDLPHTGVKLQLTYTKVDINPRLDNLKKQYYLQFTDQDHGIAFPWREYNALDHEDSSLISTDTNKNQIKWDTHIYSTEENEIINMLLICYQEAINHYQLKK